VVAPPMGATCFALSKYSHRLCACLNEKKANSYARPPHVYRRAARTPSPAPWSGSGSGSSGPAR
jgi:hypothetical protein